MRRGLKTLPDATRKDGKEQHKEYKESTCRIPWAKTRAKTWAKTCTKKYDSIGALKAGDRVSCRGRHHHDA